MKQQWKSKLLASRERNSIENESGPSAPQTQISRLLLSPTNDGTVADPLVPSLKPDSSADTQQSSTRQSKLSKFDFRGETLNHVQKRSADRRSDPLGLTLLYTTEGSPAADIIFVHGLGGTSRQTWSYNRDAKLFWPQMWLPKEPDICAARILTFGYNSHFLSSGPDSVAGIGDFAKSLLFSMKFGKDDNSGELGIGKVRSRDVRCWSGMLTIC
jgi:hypothetical protein